MPQYSQGSNGRCSVSSPGAMSSMAPGFSTCGVPQPAPHEDGLAAVRLLDGEVRRAGDQTDDLLAGRMPLRRVTVAVLSRHHHQPPALKVRKLAGHQYTPEVGADRYGDGRAIVGQVQSWRRDRMRRRRAWRCSPGL